MYWNASKNFDGKMNIKEYIASGILELYIYGALSEEENLEVSKRLHEYPEIKEEVEEIEQALQELGAAVAPYNPEQLLASIKEKLSGKSEPVPVIEVEPKRKTNWPAYIGFAASIALLVGLFAVMNDNRSLRKSLQEITVENVKMEQQIVNARENSKKTKHLLSVYRNRELTKTALEGQKIAPTAYAAVIWDKEENKAYIDAQGLPTPPVGKVYQVWSLTLNPLKPTSLGLLKDFDKDDNKIFILPNSNESQAFGITLEPAGGSETPTMEQLYTLGVIKTQAS